MRSAWIYLLFAFRVCKLFLRLSIKHTRKWWTGATEPRVQLRDALTGEKLGMTKKQHRRLMLALGTKDDRQIIKAFKEVQDRKRQMEGT